MACALAHQAYLEDFRTVYHRLHRLLELLADARQERGHLHMLKQLGRTDVLALDDWGLHGIGHRQQRDLMELLEDRYTLRSSIVTRQYPIEKWHETMGNPALADAILDRLVNNAYRIQLTGESMHKIKGKQELHSQSIESSIPS